jgi:hypothetical protein
MDSTCANLSGGNSRRGSQDSLQPMYNYSGGFGNSGLPPDSTNSSTTAQHVENHESEEVTEIHLSPPHEQREMVETKKEPFAPGLQLQQRSDETDATMEDDSGLVSPRS